MIDTQERKKEKERRRVIIKKKERKTEYGVVMVGGFTFRAPRKRGRNVEKVVGIWVE